MSDEGLHVGFFFFDGLILGLKFVLHRFPSPMRTDGPMAGRHASLPYARAAHGRTKRVPKSMVPTTGESPEDVNTSSPQGLSVPATPGGARATLPSDATGGGSPAEGDAGAPFAGNRSSRSRRRLRDYAVTDVPEVLHPAAKAQMGLTRKSKSASRELAMQIFPEVHASSLGLQKHHGRAEALLIAAHGHMHCSPSDDELKARVSRALTSSQ
jgi:hypothetical protein